MDCSPPGSSVHGILQARILEWVAIPFSRRSSQPRDWTWVSCIAGGFFIIWVTSSKESACNAEDTRDACCPWVRKIPWRRVWQATPVFWSRETHGQRSPSLQSMGLQRVGHDWSNWAHSNTMKVRNIRIARTRTPWKISSKTVINVLRGKLSPGLDGSRDVWAASCFSCQQDLSCTSAEEEQFPLGYPLVLDYTSPIDK